MNEGIEVVTVDEQEAVDGALNDIWDKMDAKPSVRYIYHKFILIYFSSMIEGFMQSCLPHVLNPLWNL